MHCAAAMLDFGGLLEKVTVLDAHYLVDYLDRKLFIALNKKR